MKSRLFIAVARKEFANMCKNVEMTERLAIETTIISLLQL